LHYFRRSRFADGVRDDAARLPVNERDDVGWRFFEPMKVNNSSISNVSALVTARAGVGKLVW
jgi:hypothetical protein